MGDYMSNKRVKISEFVEKELQFFRDECNFLPDEMEFFNLRSKGKGNIEISFTMHISERSVCNLSKSVNKKIIKVL